MRKIIVIGCIGLLVVAAIFLLFWKKVAHTDETTISSSPEIVEQQQWKIVFSAMEDLNFNVYSSNVDGSQRIKILSVPIKASDVNRYPPVLYAFASPLGDKILYEITSDDLEKHTSHMDRFVMNSDGTHIRKFSEIIGRDEHDFIAEMKWSPDEKSIVYAFSPPAPKVQGMQELSFDGNGYEWHLFDVNDKTDKIIIPSSPEKSIEEFIGWLDKDHLLFINSHLGGAETAIYDLHSHTLQNTDLYSGTSRILPNPSHSRTALALGAGICGEEYSCKCDFVEMNTVGGTQTQLFSANDRNCTAAWDGDNKLLYQTASKPEGGVTTSGYIIQRNIHSYDLESRKDETVLEADGQDLYEFYGVKDGSMIISHGRSGRKPLYVLEAHDLRNSKILPLFNSEHKIEFVGWVH